MEAEALAEVQHHELAAVSDTYLIIGFVLLLLMVVILSVRMPGEKDTGCGADIKSSLQRL